MPGFCIIERRPLMAEVKNIAEVAYAPITPSSSTTFYVEDNGTFERASIAQIKSLLGITALEERVTSLEGST